MRIVTFILFTLLHCTNYSQGVFAPPAGQIGSTAIHKDSAAIVHWAESCEVVRGRLDIADSTIGLVSFGSEIEAIDMANGTVVSLGDKGSAVLQFNGVVFDGPGYDFAVFENSFSDDFLELAFVEVSSDGINFVRFPATCDLQDSVQIGPFGSSDATQINNLAGKYRAQFGTPFDLSELAGNPDVDINEIRHIRIIDCVGSLHPEFASQDQYGQRINDPYPTPFSSGGFDLDALGIIHYQEYTEIIEHIEHFSVFPNPTRGLLNINCTGFVKAEIQTMQGRSIKYSTQQTINCASLANGNYIIKVFTENGFHNQIFMKR